MARTLGCADVGYECAYRLTTEDGQDDFILDTTLRHAAVAHPELSENVNLREDLRKNIRDLLAQAKYDPDQI